MSWMVSDPKFSPNHLSHPLTRPHLSSKAVCLSSLSHKLGQFRSLIFTQTWRCARRRLVSQGLHTLLPGTLHIHWLTAPSLTPRASAISVCFQPSSFNSKARKRLPSRQSLAWLDNVFSIVEYSIPLSLHLYAEISRNSSRSLAPSVPFFGRSPSFGWPWRGSIRSPRPLRPSVGTPVYLRAWRTGALLGRPRGVSLPSHRVGVSYQEP